jgi:hypothetical protein
MTNYNQKSLTDGRLKNFAIGSNDGRIGSDSNYLVSNDGVQTMDLPMQFYPPRKREPNNSKTPILIPPLKYIVYNNPQVCYDYLINKGYNVDNKIPSVYQYARIYVKEYGDTGILDFIKNCHPDKDMILKACKEKKEMSSFSDDTKTTTPTTTSTSKEETKTEDSWIKVNSKTIIIVLAVVVFFLIINRTSKG